MTEPSPVTLDYADGLVASHDSLPPPYVEATIRGPAGVLRALCLLDTGADRSAFPLSMAERLGVNDRLEECEITVAGGRTLDGLVLPDTDTLTAEISDLPPTPIAPRFLPPIPVDGGGEREITTFVLGRDFLVWHQVCFDQLMCQVTIMPGDELQARDPTA